MKTILEVPRKGIHTTTQNTRLSLEILKQGLEDICQLFCRWDLCTGRWWNRERGLSYTNT